VDDNASELGPEVAAIVAGARYQLRKCQERADILAAVLQLTDRFDEVCALVRASESAEALVSGLAGLLGVGERAARAAADMQVRTLAPYRHRLLAAEREELSQAIGDLQSILDSRDRQRELIGTERGDYLAGQQPRDPGSPE
jgi:DNA gyrase subunit A